MRKYVDSCRTYTILLQDSGLLPRPNPNWNTFKPKIGDVAHVDKTNTDYRWNGNQWEEIVDGE